MREWYVGGIFQRCLQEWNKKVEQQQSSIETKEGATEGEDAAGPDGGTADVAFMSGMGIHVGEMLFIESTDVHWGDPVNTASKLGQDLAKDGEIIMSEKVHQMLSQSGELASDQVRAESFRSFVS